MRIFQKIEYVRYVSSSLEYTFLRGWPVGVELVAGLTERPGSQQRHFLQAPKDVFVCSVLIYVQRIIGFTTMRYINLRFTYLLTYLHFAIQRCKLHRATCRRFDTIPACDRRTDGRTELL